jgi:hypothetical protein
MGSQATNQRRSIGSQATNQRRSMGSQATNQRRSIGSQATNQLAHRVNITNPAVRSGTSNSYRIASALNPPTVPASVPA